MDLSNLLASFGSYEAKASRRVKKDARARFIDTATAQLKVLDQADPTSPWITKRTDGRIVVCARIGVVPLCVGGDQNYQFVCKDADAAKGYINALIEYAKAGSLDERLTATARGKKGGAA